MEVGIIAPTSLLNKYCKERYQYCLPSLILEEESYRVFYKNRRTLGDILVLDCRKLGWKRVPEDIGIIEEACKEVDPQVILTPSNMFSISETKKTLGKFLNSRVTGDLIGTLEGTRKEEVEDLKIFYRNIDIMSYAVPSHLYNFYKGSPKEVYFFIENHTKIEELEGLKGVLLTSLPVRLGLQGRLLSDYLPTPPLLTFEEYKDTFPKVIERNIREAVTILK